jgi:uncharacterized SAM-binding protein YcdF (DUF218 family)
MAFLKSLLHLAQPIGFVWLLLSVWLLWSVWRRRWSGLWMPALAWLVLTVCTCTPTTSYLLNDLENAFPAVSVADVTPAEVIICLGGGAEPSNSEPTRVNFNSSVDRMTTALALYAQKKAPLLVITGGGYEKDGVMYSEADAAFGFLKSSLAIPINVISLGVCSDTHDEALKIAALAEEKGWKSFILVTSATHMPRAVATFRKAGVEVSAVPCDYQSSFNRITDIDWIHLPHNGSFASFGAWMHEVIGTWVYSWRGWL